ncbi:MAG: hypothetical protein P1U58_10820 [Verrucomicrobiales bacterium]|nr:hypothetical protein [Verrucomicrobiales bacterium]
MNLPTFAVMILDTGNRIIDDLERRFGGLALPQILRWIAGFQAFTWALSLFSPDLLAWIVYDREAIFMGQVWRLFSWVLLPAAQNPLFVLITVLFMFFINDSLESHWSSFRLNVYVLSSIFCLALIGLIPALAGAGLMMNGIFYSAAFFAFATLFPNQIIHLFLIIPIKAKWLGWAGAALLGASIISSPAPLLIGLLVAAGLLPYLLAFIPGIISGAKQRSENAVRRHRFEQATQSESTFFHECEKCGANDQSSPELEFRVNDEGHEICERCRSEK